MAYVRTADTLLPRFTFISSHCATLSRLLRVQTSGDGTKFTKCIAPFPLLATCVSDKIPDVPQMPPIEDTAPVLNALGEPTFTSLGLNSYWPSGWYQAVLEFLHVNLNLPWWAAIATTTVVIRLCLIPFVIKQRRKLASYTNIMPHIHALQNRMTKARITSNYIEMMKVSQEMQQLMKNNDFNPLSSMSLVFVQVPIFLSVFAGLRGMAQLPVESLQTGGLGWFADLTVCDPFYILPLYSMSSIFLMFEFGADVSSQGITPGVRLAMRVFPVVGFFMIMHMPSALLWYWSISNTISISQALILRTKSVRTYLNFPQKVESPPQSGKKKGFVEGFKESMSNSRLLAELEARERTDAERWQKAGMGAVPKTFAHDITARAKKPIIDAKGTVVPGKNHS
ncbi:Mitochondrial inner membrane protein OXA1L [Taenia crassiceps]|uniref:Mitochondrial inner membrane protein OXA1L n=1 Tax=Taenia crassiceps TaxID=6207 RepID=A0ABR4QJ18_9CEST